jgi:hypothetical protein
MMPTLDFTLSLAGESTPVAAGGGGEGFTRYEQSKSTQLHPALTETNDRKADGRLIYNRLAELSTELHAG